jgi:MYXO-CTERM domain-containing protein
MAGMIGDTTGAAGASGGAGGAGTAAGGTTGDPVVVGPVPSSGCACALEPGAGKSGAMLLPLLGALAVVRRRRR